MSISHASEVLRSIAVRVEGDTPAAADPYTGNVMPLLHEVRHALGRLLANGEETTIDLASLPLTPGELDRIVAALGKGEVTATLDALGPSEVRESRYSGVWLVTHRNGSGEVMGRYIEIARMPAVLLAQEPDMRRSLADLEQALASQER